MVLKAQNALQKCAPVLKNYFQKSDEIGLLVNFSKIIQKDYSVKYLKNIENMSPQMLQAEIGATSYQISKILEANVSKYNNKITKAYEGLNGIAGVSHRTKDAASVAAKYKRAIKNGNVRHFEDALNSITDGRGTRIYLEDLPKLSNPEIKQMVNEFRLKSQELSPHQKKLLFKCIYQHPMSPTERMEAFPIFEKFTKPLVEKRSQPAVDELMLSVVKHRLNSGEITLEQVKKHGILPENLIQRFETDKDIIPWDLEVLENYRGMYGLPEFSNNQVQAIYKASGGKVSIHSRADILDYERHPGFSYTKEEMADLAIKKSGYRTTQINIKENGIYREIQYRGLKTNIFGEEQHLPYNLQQLKNILCSMERKYAQVYPTLKPAQKVKYYQYFEDCFDYFNRVELGLPARFPKLPKGLDEILSAQSLKKIYKEKQTATISLKNNFIPHFEAVA